MDYFNVSSAVLMAGEEIIIILYLRAFMLFDFFILLHLEDFDNLCFFADFYYSLMVMIDIMKALNY
jgi:hypothetical protein